MSAGETSEPMKTVGCLLADLHTTNYRGPYNAALDAAGQRRLPDNWDVHHTTPQDWESADHELHHLAKGRDIHHPSQLRGVPGYNQPGTVTVIEASGLVRKGNAHSEIHREIEQFLVKPRSRAELDEFLKYLDWRWGHIYWENGAGQQ